jgi:superoxide dismutase
MKAELSAKSIAIQGSGWGWLGYNTATGAFYFLQELR